MTTPKSEDLLPIQFKSAQEFQNRAEYQPSLICETSQLDRIVGKYTFTKAEQLECGLNGCRTRHWNGWVIKTKDGKETHCGKDCGEREFGVLFTEIEAKYKAAEERQSRRNRLEELANARDSILAAAKGLYEQVNGAGNLINDVVKEIKRDSGLERVFQTCVRADGRILVEDEDSKRLRAAMGAKTGKADLKQIGLIKGLSVVSSQFTVAQELKYRVILPLQELTTESLNTFSDRELGSKTQQFSQLQQTLSSARGFLATFQQFSSPANGKAFTLLEHGVPKNSRTGRVGRILTRIERMYDAPTAVA
jgi:hypothetical protein